MQKCEYLKLFEGVDDAEIKLLTPLIEEVVELDERMEELRKIPFIIQHPKNPALQKRTEAARLHKELSQSRMNAIRILRASLWRVDRAGADELLEKLSEFM